MSLCDNCDLPMECPDCGDTMPTGGVTIVDGIAMYQRGYQAALVAARDEFQRTVKWAGERYGERKFHTEVEYELLEAIEVRLQLLSTAVEANPDRVASDSRGQKL